MRPWILAAVWVAIAFGVWNALFDLYVSRGAREYLQLVAEHQLGRGSEPSMPQVMARAAADGRIMAGAWASVVAGAGLATVWWGARRQVRNEKP